MHNFLDKTIADICTMVVSTLRSERTLQWKVSNIPPGLNTYMDFQAHCCACMAEGLKLHMLRATQDSQEDKWLRPRSRIFVGTSRSKWSSAGRGKKGIVSIWHIFFLCFAPRYWLCRLLTQECGLNQLVQKHPLRSIRMLPWIWIRCFRP